MDALLSRYRSLLLLVVVIAAQIVLLAYQVKNESDVRIIRVWAVTAVTPIARVVEAVRSGVTGFVSNYISLHDVRAENRMLRSENGQLKIQNRFLETELASADRVKALSAFVARTPSKMMASRIIGTAAGAANKVVFLDRGSSAGVEKGMAVVTPDGIVGEVLAAYPTASQAMLVTDPGFAAGVISQRNHVRGVLKGLGYGRCKIDYVQNEEKVDVGEMFYTSGDDRVFPKGLPVGKVTAVRAGERVKDIFIDPSGLQNGPEEVLIILEGVHQIIPEEEVPQQKVYLGAPAPAEQPNPEAAAAAPVLQTDADRTLEKFRKLNVEQGNRFGLPGRAGNFNPNQPARPPAPAPKTAGPKTGEVQE